MPGFRQILVGLLAVGVLGGTLIPQDVVAAEEKKPAPTTIDENTGKRLSEAIEALNAENYSAAKAAIAKLNFDKLSPYEKSRAEQILASVAVATEDYNGALKHIQASIASGGLSDPEIAQAEFQIAQLFMAQERWQEGIKALKGWMAKTPNPNASVYYLLAAAYYQLNDYKSAMAPAEKAIAMAEKPQESWLQLLLALYLQQDQYAKGIPLVKRLIAASPDKKTYWIQLSSMYAQLEKYDEAVVPLQVAYRAGLLTDEGEVKRLAELLLFNQLSYRGGTILAEAIAKNKVKADSKVWETLANSWIAAREYDRSIQPLNRAAEMSDNGNLFVRLGEVQAQREKWADVSDAILKGVNKGGLRNAADANLLMGIANYNQKKLKEAKTWFERARGSAKTKAQADTWIKHIDHELVARAS